MKRHYLSLWLLLLCAFVIFAVSSAFDMPYLGEYQLKSSGIADALRPPKKASTTPLPVPADSAEINADSIGSVGSGSVGSKGSVPAPCDTSTHTILLIGDSMLEGIAPRLAAYADHNGHTLYSVMWYSSTSKIWGSSDKLRNYISRLNPSFIIVCLGANELTVRDIASARRQYVEKIIEDIDTIPYLWIGPPNWRRDTGINALISSVASEGSFFLSDGMDFERTADGAHPTRSSAALWVDSVMRWMPANARHPIRMDFPEADASRPKRVFVHKPTEK